MEISYDSGAKVILQGPVRYEVESAAGGFLSVGKLTAKVESAKQQAAISKSPNLQISKLFVVKTPTATVTDLGTEFGVEVSKSGTTETHVFVGKIRVAGCGGGRSYSGADSTGRPSGAARPHAATARSSKAATSNLFARCRWPSKQPCGTYRPDRLQRHVDGQLADPRRQSPAADDPESLRVEQCHGNPPRWWVFARKL